MIINLSIKKGGKNMAIGNSEIAQIRAEEEQFTSLNGNLRDCHNTFNYVTNHLADWATETEVGTSVRNQARKYTDQVQQITNIIEQLVNKMNEFVQHQRSINKGS